MKKGLFAATWLLWLLAARPVAGQAFLEQLEQQIRQQLTPAASGSADAQDAAPAVQPPANPSAAPVVQAVAQAANAPAPERGYLGIVTDDRLDRGRGVRILEVRAGGPADKAGLRAQDLITGLGGIRVRQMSDLAAILEQVAPGGSLKFDLVRGTQSLQLEVTFGRRPDGKQEAVTQTPKLPAAKPADLDLVAPSFPDQPKPSPAAGATGSSAPRMPITPPAPAAAGSGPSDRARIEALERRVKLLEDQIQQLLRDKSQKK